MVGFNLHFEHVGERCRWLVLPKNRHHATAARAANKADREFWSCLPHGKSCYEPNNLTTTVPILTSPNG